MPAIYARYFGIELLDLRKEVLVMRKLDRASVYAPSCLAEYKQSGSQWMAVSHEHRAEIRTKLEQMQGLRCAYCECALDERNQHIEHFRPINAFPNCTFQWSNLYWSCNQSDSCGHYKDNKKKVGVYNSDDLIEPCMDDPDSFFRFRSDGTISVRVGLSEVDMHKAQETLRVFNLQPTSGRLRNMRKEAVSGYISIVVDCDDFSEMELQSILLQELTAISCLPFSTAIRHVLTRLFE
jgi:uncharacterized protein (TIGR02646 family)